MKQLIPSGTLRLLLVEGKMDQEFFVQWGYVLKFTKQTSIQFLQYDGKDNLAQFLVLVMNDPNFRQVKKIGIVRDADYNTDAFQSVITAIDQHQRNERGCWKMLYWMSCKMIQWHHVSTSI